MLYFVLKTKWRIRSVTKPWNSKQVCVWFYPAKTQHSRGAVAEGCLFLSPVHQHQEGKVTSSAANERHWYVDGAKSKTSDAFNRYLPSLGTCMWSKHGWLKRSSVRQWAPQTSGVQRCSCHVRSEALTSLQSVLETLISTLLNILCNIWLAPVSSYT